MHGTIWCLHGAVGSATDWHRFSIPGWKVRPIDLWRFLYDELKTVPMDRFGAALNAEARAATGEGKQVLLGYSMGARLALHALLPKDSPWDAAVLVAPHPGLENPDERLQRRMADLKWAEMARELPWNEFLAAWNAQPVLAASPSLEDRSGLVRRRPAIAASFWSWSLAAQQPLWPRLPEIGIPVLWVTGERDAKFRALADRAIPLLPRAESWVAPGCGHRVPWEAPEAFAARAGEFLERAVS